jgi:uncharacterized protein
MKCPVDGTTLQIAERAGLEIDYCPDCRGIWLDRGELDKLIERGNIISTAPPPPPSAAATGRAGDHGAPGGPPASTAAASDRPPSVQSAAMEALRAVRELADAHKRKGTGFGRF